MLACVAVMTIRLGFRLSPRQITDSIYREIRLIDRER